VLNLPENSQEFFHPYISQKEKMIKPNNSLSLANDEPHPIDDDKPIWADEDDESVFVNEDEQQSISLQNAWKAMIIDDDEDVHEVTRFVLDDFIFQDKPINFISAFSAKEARTLLEKHSDVALIFLDVVMEKEDSGLTVAKYIRDTLKNKFAQIVLRTGQPGKAPEKSVILNYEINDYKVKTKLTDSQLFSVTVAGLRSYQELMTLEDNKVLLKQINNQLQEEIEERRRTEEKLLVTQFSVDNAADAIFWIASDARIIYANKAAYRSLGYLPGELCSIAVHDLDPNFPSHAWTEHWIELKQRNCFTFESQHKSKNGDIFPVEITVNYMVINGVEYNFAFVRDITERKRIEKERIKFIILKQKNELIRQIFGRYLSDEIVNTLLETESGLALGGERHEITILTSDIRGFTARSNQLPPEQVIKVINFYLTAMTEVITKYQGTIDEFMGDGILVLFGAPIAREDDPERAVACAVAMQLAMNQVNEQMIAWGFEPLDMGIGVNTGEVVVGNIGSEKRTKYGVIGNEVNLTYRIESYTTGGQIFISEPTLRKVDEIVKIRSERQVLSKGIKHPINIYEVDGIDGKYHLHLHKKEEELFLPLKKEIPLQYAILEGKQVGEKKFKGCLLKLSATGALIRCDVEKNLLPAPLDNLKMHLVLPNASSNHDDIYAKVLSHGVDEKSLYIHFTNMPIHIKARLVALYKMEWTPEMSINHPLLDKQHQQIFSKLNELNIVAYHVQDKEVAEIINFLEHHAMTHFKDEEQVMKQYDYPYYTIHQAQHLTYIEKLKDFRQKYQQNQGNNLHLVLEIQKETVDWLIRHIGDSDRQFGIFLKEKLKV
jgi:hemerythrin-like metal-binding protein/PAS domain S-box-containing protein